MYENAYVHTKFNGIRGDSWKVRNGVRQGGVLSSALFCFYINDMLQDLARMTAGCSLMGYKTNVICYADDILLLAPSATGLRTLLDTLYYNLSSLCLKVNAQKSKCIVFRRKGYNPTDFPVFKLGGATIERVKSIKYLGVVLEEHGDTKEDISRTVDAFLRQFNAVYAKFNFIDRKTLYFLFKTYTSSFYGIDVWFTKIPAMHLDRICIPYHKAVKKVCDLKPWDSNHNACEIVGVSIFRHLLAKRLICMWHNLIKPKTECLKSLKYYFMLHSVIHEKTRELFHDIYDVDISDNPLCAVLARIDFVQLHEPRSEYAGI